MSNVARTGWAALLAAPLALAGCGTGRVGQPAAYFERYPGDTYADVLGSTTTAILMRQRRPIQG